MPGGWVVDHDPSEPATLKLAVNVYFLFVLFYVILKSTSFGIFFKKMWLEFLQTLT